MVREHTLTLKAHRGMCNNAPTTEGPREVPSAGDLLDKLLVLGWPDLGWPDPELILQERPTDSDIAEVLVLLVGINPCLPVLRQDDRFR